MPDYKCSFEMHNKCENSALCHLCDGIKLYKNTKEEKQQKMIAREKNKEAERNALFRTHKDEKKEGMAFEKEVAKKWNAAYAKPKKEISSFKQYDKKRSHKKPRIEIEEKTEVAETPVEKSKPVFTPISLSGLSKRNQSHKPIQDAKRQKNSGALWYAKGDIKTEDYLMECKERGTINGRGEKTITIPREWLIKQAREAYQENRDFWVIPFKYKNDDEIYLIKTFDQEIEMYQELRRLREELKNIKEEKND